MKDVVSRIETPFDLEDGYSPTFDSETQNNGQLYVPVGTADKYKTKNGWKNFMNIIEGEPTGITVVKSNEIKAMKCYTLDGNAANNSQRGINIVRMSDGTTKKVVVK